MTYIRIEDHRINIEEIARYRPVLAGEAEPGFKTEIEMSSGSTFYVKSSAERIDELFESHIFGKMLRIDV